MNTYPKIPSLYILFLFVSFLTSYGQEVKLDRANKKYKELAYIDASEIYLDLAESGYRSEELFRKLGNIYYFNAKYVDAANWYGELFSLTENLDPIYYLRYSQSLKAIGDEGLSIYWFNTYIKKNGKVNETYGNAIDYLKIIEENSGRYTMRAAKINSTGVDFGASFHKKKLVFASTQDVTKTGKRLSPWDGLSYLDLFESTISKDGSLGAPTKLKGDVNTKYHESSAVFTADGTTMYFTRNNITPSKNKRKQEIQHLKIYRAELENGKWTNVEDLSINGDNYSNAHPILSPKEDKLYFVSNRPGSLGFTDVYTVTIDRDGNLGRPKNLGPKINTKGRESFPFLTPDNELYFSSDGHYGLGGYDIFYVKIKEDGSFGNLLNVGKPLNSSFDDLAFAIMEDRGYISSNRPGGLGHDDIYSFIETEKIKDVLKSRVFGVVTDRETEEPIKNTSITLYDEGDNVFVELETDEKGFYESEVDISTSYIIKAEKEKYESKDAYSQKGQQEREHNFELDKNVIDIKAGDDIAKLFNVIIYFDLDKSNIRPDAALELEKIVSVMKLHPSINIDVRSHTDSRANDMYNMDLSERRAKSTIDYLVTRGISKTRLTSKGYGETQLVNHCSNGVSCTKAEHQLNRRSEFIVEFEK
ncbi:OmpA family protein [Ulvibacterium sp.]|uniref:OmpA family protein n=1 Tax=Ulvibacterium sp. TaxID=2665914 RepID=UPI00262AA52E|nr:OmpA family protein [Ulvibacterium sp.]